MARMVNGKANATEKASIVAIGTQNSPPVERMSTEPTIGPVQENDTSTSVRAIKKTPARPFLSLPLSALSVHFEGRVISNAPKKEAAKAMNITKNSRLGSQWVESQLKMSAVTASPPRSLVSRMMTLIGRV